MKFQDLIKVKVEKRLEKIYQERRRWNGARGPFNGSSIRRRKLILIAQQVLENFLLENKI